jgi:Fe-S-cluster-containing dehydrogenase component
MSADIPQNDRGIIIQYDYCTGCHACEVACKKELRLAEGEFGIKVMQYGPAKSRDGRWDYFFMPVTTDYCNLCADRTAMGKLPSCVHNCQSKVMEYGAVVELAKKMVEIEKCVLFSPGKKR